MVTDYIHYPIKKHVYWGLSRENLFPSSSYLNLLTNEDSHIHEQGSNTIEDLLRSTHLETSPDSPYDIKRISQHSTSSKRSGLEVAGVLQLVARDWGSQNTAFRC